MALPAKNFHGKLGGYTVKDIYFKLNKGYKLKTLDDRKEFLQNTIDETMNFYIEYYSKQPKKDNVIHIDEEENPYEEDIDYYFKSNLTKSDYLATEQNVSKLLEQMANYIIYAADAPRMGKKTEYNFYTEEQFNKIIAEDKAVPFSSLNYENSDGETVDVLNDEITMDYLVRKGMNYKLEKKQEIRSYDLREHKELYDMNELKKLLSNHIKNEKSQRKKNFYKKHKNICNKDMLFAKDCLNGTIYFKQALESHDEPNYMDELDFLNEEHVKALLRVGKKDMKTDLGHIIHDLYELISECDLTENESMVLKMYSNSDISEKEIAEKLLITQQRVNQIVDVVVNKIVHIYEEKLLNWLYLNHRKGEYKQCNKCGDIKLTDFFDKDAKSKDGFRNQCKKCRK